MKNNSLPALLEIGAALFGGCSLQQRAIDETSLYYDPSGTNYNFSIRAADPDGISKVYLLDENRKILFSEDPRDEYFPSPTSVLVFGDTRVTGESIFLDEFVKRNNGKLSDGRYFVEVIDKEGNRFEKEFTKKDDKITCP